MREVIKEGRDTNEAVALACRELGVDADQVEVEIINLPKRSFFGLKNTPAKVRVFIKEEERKQPVKPNDGRAQERIVTKPVAEEKKQIPEKETQSFFRKQPTVKAEPPKAEKAAMPEEKVQAENTQKSRAEKSSPANQDGTEQRPQTRTEQEPEKPLVFVPMAEMEGKALVACEYVQTVLAEMGTMAEITVAKREGGIVLRLAGEGLGVVIGRRGETLDSLQYLSSLVANRAEGDYMRVTIDSGNYREKRERTLQQLAQRLSTAAIRSGRSSTLEPMNPYERRIIHSAVSNIEGVTSSSIGVEPNRRVVISPMNARPQSGPMRGKGPRDARGGRDLRDNRDGKMGYRGGKPQRRTSDGHPEGGFHEREPRRDGIRPPRPQGDGAAKPTPTDVDRAYAKELEKETFPVREPVEVQEKTMGAPVREKGLNEGTDLPLYGKIDI